MDESEDLKKKKNANHFGKASQNKRTSNSDAREATSYRFKK
jgi:hypothetical protein